MISGLSMSYEGAALSMLRCCMCGMCSAYTHYDVRSVQCIYGGSCLLCTELRPAANMHCTQRGPPSAAARAADRNSTAGTNSLLTARAASPVGSVAAACAAWWSARCTASAACCNSCWCCCWCCCCCCCAALLGCCCRRSHGLAGADPRLRVPVD